MKRKEMMGMGMGMRMRMSAKDAVVKHGGDGAAGAAVARGAGAGGGVPGLGLEEPVRGRLVGWPEVARGRLHDEREGDASGDGLDGWKRSTGGREGVRIDSGFVGGGFDGAEDGRDLIGPVVGEQSGAIGGGQTFPREPLGVGGEVGMVAIFDWERIFGGAAWRMRRGRACAVWSSGCRRYHGLLLLLPLPRSWHCVGDDLGLQERGE